VREAAFIDLIVQAYRAEKTEGKDYRAFEILNLGEVRAAALHRNRTANKRESKEEISVHSRSFVVDKNEPLMHANKRESEEEIGVAVELDRYRPARPAPRVAALSPSAPGA